MRESKILITAYLCINKLKSFSQLDQIFKEIDYKSDKYNLYLKRKLEIDIDEEIQRIIQI